MGLYGRVKIYHTIVDTSFISIITSRFDAGYIYEYMIDQKEDIPYRFKMVDDADNIEISSYVYR